MYATTKIHAWENPPENEISINLDTGELFFGSRVTKKSNGCYEGGGWYESVEGGIASRLYRIYGIWCEYKQAGSPVISEVMGKTGWSGTWAQFVNWAWETKGPVPFL